MHKLRGSARRVGHSYVATPVDVETDFACYSVKNRTIGGSTIALELGKLEGLTEKGVYVAFKVRGKWFIAESLRQHIDHHGEIIMEEDNE